MRRLPLALAVLVAGELTAAAAPVDVSVVPADAGAVIHVDLDAVRRSKIYGLARTLAGGDPAQHLLSEVDDDKDKVIVETLLASQSVTIWLDGKGDKGVGCFYGADTAKLARGLAAMKDHSTEKLGKRTVHRFGKGDEDRVVIEGRWVLIAEEPEALTKTLAALDGAAPRMARQALEPNMPGAVLLVAVLGDDLLAHVAQHANSKMLGKGGLESARFVVGESGDKLLARAQVTMRNVDDAIQVEKLAGGIMALGALAAEDDAHKTLLQNVRTTRTDKVVVVDLSLSHADLMKFLAEHQ
jgi:hypothetical protein